MKGESVSERVPARVPDRLIHLQDCLRTTINLVFSRKLICNSKTGRFNIPGSTLLTQSSPTIDPFSTFGNEYLALSPPSEIAECVFFQL